MDKKAKMDNREFISTGQAATLCSVTRNTVFKWIQSGHLVARRTAGGHHRIDRRDLERFMSVSSQPLEESNQDGNNLKSDAQPRFQYCWEYNGIGKTQEECMNCAVYKLRALRCYEGVKLAPDVRHAKIFCDQNCEECHYYQEMHDKKANVLVVTNDPHLSDDLMSQADESAFNLEITDCEYNCAAIIDHFNPDFVIIDCKMGQEVCRKMSSHIMKDPRIPYVRVVLAGSSSDYSNECDREVFARMTRPFNISNISECISISEVH